ncbi:hypothetical protein [Psychrobacter sp. FDAARGOS_221]|uniref:hypothetical protein n=1 Tax=Psychrobacter sp. FDAARGOS_221 TaxID=1975705 RepID=UPI000BB59B79|nr:hypothetical protein [Psychrobacter sp. FDAARGOS_221]PNK60944.1 hypothetical protein A6J60_008675 [Psychrobacter sp. FDAARGOS_221]
MTDFDPKKQPLSYFAQKQQQINTFVAEANTLLADNPLCYTGHFISGQPLRPDILFVSINPGHSNRENWEDIEARQAQAVVMDFEVVDCKYIADAARGSRYANRIVDVICGGDVSRLKHCAETSFVSYFAAPKEAVLQAQLSELPEPMQQIHDELTRLAIEQINPKHIICMGWRSFDRFLQHYGEGNEITVHKLPLMGKMEDYYATTEVNGVTVHGLRHLCTKLSLEMRARLGEIFTDIWIQIECGNVK